jgi:hypothetical protein
MGNDKEEKNKEFSHSTEDLFPDYEPKLTPDTALDYISCREEYREKTIRIIRSISEPKLQDLKQILTQFNHYSKMAEEKPGHYIDGNMILGAPPKEYIPSEAEIVVSELGKSIRSILYNNPVENIQNYKMNENIKSKKLKFTEIIFTHCDVMGSGRFFYAEKSEHEIELDL